MGFAVDCHRFWSGRRRLRRYRVGQSIADFLLWVSFAAGVFGLLLLLNDGEVHFYVFLGLGLGLLIYYRSYSRWVLSWLKKISQKYKKG